MDAGRAETGSRNMAATEKINFLTLISYSLLQTVFRYDVPFRHNTKRHRQTTTDRRQTTKSVPKARPIVRSAKNHGLGQYGAEPHYSTLPFWQLCALKGKSHAVG